MPGNGSAQLREIAARCKVVGNRGLLNATRATLRVEAKPIAPRRRTPLEPGFRRVAG
jgi:hypothetical protein